MPWRFWRYALLLGAAACIALGLWFLLPVGGSGSDTGLPAADLVSACRSALPHKSSFCGGYLDATAHYWKSRASCQSLLPSEGAYCAGAADARDRLSRNEAPGSCGSRGEERAGYCRGYQMQAAVGLAVAERAGDKGLPLMAPRTSGLAQAVEDIGLHLWASGEFWHLTPCIPLSMTSQEVRRVLAKFVREHPEQTRDTSATLVLTKALYYGVCPGPKRKLHPHMEQCTAWSVRGGRFGTTNTCRAAVTVRYQLEDDPVVQRRLAPGEVLTTGRTAAPLHWFTTCPEGYVADLSLEPSTRAQVGASRYSCAPE